MLRNLIKSRYNIVTSETLTCEVTIIKVAIVFGGNSEERDVSIASGAQVLQALRARGHQVLAVDTARGLLSSSEERELLQLRVRTLPPRTDELSLIRAGTKDLANTSELSDVDIFFLALHGGIGEDGTIQAALDLAGMPYTGSGHIPSVYAMDKDVAKRLFTSCGISTPAWLMAPVTVDDVEARLKYPVIVKPNKQGSTIGLTLVHDATQLMQAIDVAYQHDDEVMIENYLEGRELTVGILDDQPLTVGEVIPLRSTIFDYASKYQEGGAQEIFPADIPDSKAAEVCDTALKVHKMLKLSDYSRVDFVLDDNDHLWCLEANSLPGLTPTSLLPKSAAASGIQFDQLCEKICELALSRRQSEKNDLAKG